MNDLPLHPILVHIPIALSLIMPFIYGFILWGQKKNIFSPQTWLLLVLIQTFTAGGAMLAMQAWHQDEEKVEKVVPEAALETHEEWGEFVAYASLSLLALFLVPVIIKKAQFAKPLAFAGSLMMLVPVINTGHTGGILVYQHNAAKVHAETSTSSLPGDTAQPNSGQKKSDKDDDD